ncbi:ras GEF, partial [Ramicandelaber brevisporus]
VARQVVTHEDHNERVKLVQTFIMVAHQCMVWHNYNTCFEIVTGLMLSPVQRLTSTWAKVSSKYQQMLDQLHTIMSQLETLAASRAGHDIPVIPFLAVHLTDLLYADEGN